ncbi:MAG TPA: site-2 protease family protein [Frankiaceae bacterium]|jgi:membrane-associated protease RseP (regulator of RpoE activity)|nr:site-2 protease family protein [Frankiaceae bacterium]
MAALGVFVFVFALLASIALHELGHLGTAKAFGMKASRYFIGMGPTLWSTRRGETEYGVKAFPVGGFVKIVGMTQLEDLEDPRDEPRAFWRQPAPQRAVVLAAGSAMHFVVAFVVLVGTLLAYGEQTRDTTRVAEVSECLSELPTDPCDGKPPAPAKVAGLREGDRIVAFQGTPVRSWDAFTTLVRAADAGPADLVVERDGERVTLHPVVERHEREIAEGQRKVIGQIGVTPGETKRYNVLTVGPRAGSALAEFTVNSVSGLWHLPGKIPQLFEQTTASKGEQPRDPGDGGVVGIVDIGRLSAQAFEAGQVDAVLFMIVGLNVFIGLFNLLPLLPLDGGHLAILGFEEARSGIARSLGRPDPGRVDLQRLMPAMVAFIVLMGGLTVMLLYAGIANPIANPF